MDKLTRVKRMTEKSFQDWCVKQAKAAGWLVYKTHSPNNRGFPDLTMVSPPNRFAGVNVPRVVFVELKNPNGSGGLTRIQADLLNQLIDRGVEAYECNSRDQFVAILDREVECRPVAVRGQGRRL